MDILGAFVPTGGTMAHIYPHNRGAMFIDELWQRGDRVDCAGSRDVVEKSNSLLQRAAFGGCQSSILAHSNRGSEWMY